VPVTEKWRGIFEEFQTALVVYGALVIRRRAAPGAYPAWTERRKMPADAASYLGWFRWRDRLSEPEERHKLLAAAPRLAPDLKLTVTHQVENGGLVPAAFRLQNGGRPFPAATEVDGWVASLMNRFDGRAAAGAVYEEMRKAGHLPQSLVTEHFIELLASLIERGFVEVENGV